MCTAMERWPRHVCIRCKNICLSYNLWHWPPPIPSPSCSNSVHGSTVCAQMISWPGTARLSPTVATRQPGQPYTRVSTSSCYYWNWMKHTAGIDFDITSGHLRGQVMQLGSVGGKVLPLLSTLRNFSWCGLHLSRFIVSDIKTEETLKYLLTIVLKQ